MSQQENRLDLDPEFQLQSGTVFLEFIQADEGFRLVNGFKYRYAAAESPDWSGRKKAVSGSIHNSLTYHITSGFNQEVDIILSLRQQHMMPEVRLISSLSTTGNTVELGLYAGTSSPENENDVQYWTDRGYSFFTVNGYLGSMENNLPETKTVSADLTWRAIRRRWQGVFSFIYKRIDRTLLTQQTFEYHIENDILSAPYMLYPEAKAALVGGSMHLKYQLTAALSQTVDMSMHQVISGSDVFAKFWDSRPDLSVNFISDYQPENEYAVQLMVRYRAGSHWFAYDGIDDASDEYYSSKIPHFWITDVTVSKMFWKQRLRGVMTIQNAFNEPLHSHPVGSYQHLTFFIKASIRL